MSTFLQQPLLYIKLLLFFALVLCVLISEQNIQALRFTCLLASLGALLLGCLSFASFNQSLAGFQFLIRLDVLPLNNLTFTLGADGLSMIFLLLTLFVFPICFASA